MEITIEDLSIRMLDKLYEIEKQCFEKEAFTKQQIAYLVGDYNSIGLAARVDSEIVGFAIARVDIRRNMRFGHILTVDVVPAYRRKGIARKLLTQIEDILGQKGAKECRLEVRENNAAALSLYEKLGYKKVGKLEKYYGDAHGLYLRKIL
ncbi:MAG: ribosomal protein S18-alanine N-acetyltransferase [Candidatus Bathyarchaeota archaeon]|nr:ribosomal protein S18-alanine N-acetyltransferase [Candidatus Bathyarchaeota archaeon]